MKSKQDAGEKRVILLVDDDINLLRMVRKFLIGQGYEVFTAQNGKEAVKKTVEVKPTLIVTDLEMPGVDGLTFTSALKKHPVAKRIPLIVLTAHSGITEMQSSYQAGADLFLEKPVKLNQLKQYIDSLLTTGELKI
ncbi:response regulator [bacterium]|nr:response regulator [candidate division CSSED10-310 bacterium]